MRARDIGLFTASGRTGPLNAIVDVPGVAVGHVTRIAGDGPLVVGEGPVRTGVTVVVPRPEPLALNPVFAGIGRLNGNGEMTGSHWIEESGLLTSPIALTNTHSVGVVRDALVIARLGEQYDLVTHGRVTDELKRRYVERADALGIGDYIRSRFMFCGTPAEVESQIRAAMAAGARNFDGAIDADVDEHRRRIGAWAELVLPRFGRGADDGGAIDG